MATVSLLVMDTLVRAAHIAWLFRFLCSYIEFCSINQSVIQLNVL